MSPPYTRATAPSRLDTGDVPTAGLSRWIVLLALLLTAVMGLVTIQIEGAYLSNYPLSYDPVEYSFHNARLHARLAEEGRLPLALREYFGNPRNPLRTVPLILLAPGLLAHPLGHLGTTLPALFGFLGLLGWTVKRRSGSLPYALACMTLFCATPRFFDPNIGLGAYWLDLPASLLIGGASLCLLNSDGARDLRWLSAFATLASFAALSRYVAAAFAFVACGPVLFFYLLERWRKESRLRTILLPLGVVTFVVGGVAGPMLVAHLRNNVFYYSALAWGIGGDPEESARFLARFLVDYVDPRASALRALGCFALIAPATVHAVALGKREAWRWSSVLVSAWLAGAIPLFIFAVLQTSADPSVTLYVLPGAFTALVTPTPLTECWRTRRSLARLASPLLVIALALGAYWARAWWGWVTQPPIASIRDQKAFDIALASELSRQGDGLVWNAFFDETGHIHSMEAFYRFGKLVLPAGPRYFSIHDAYWKGFYPTLSPLDVAERVYAATSRWVDIAVVLDDPARATANVSRIDPNAGNPHSRFIARFVAERIAADPRWRRAFRVESADYGAVAGYRNLESHGRGYRTVLRSHSLFFTPIAP